METDSAVFRPRRTDRYFPGNRVKPYRVAVGFRPGMAFTAVTLGYFHDRFWLPRDDGYYAHIAERILDGEVLHRDVQGLHAGLVYFANAAALELFGRDLVSLRYPLVALGFVQVCLMFFLFLRRGMVTAAAASVALTSMSFVQFVNPTAHWYSLFVLVTIVCALQWMPPRARRRLETVGFLVATLFLFRQLTGVFVAIGVLAYLITEAGSRESHLDRRLARVVVGVMIAGLAAFLLRKTDGLGWLLFGVWPLALLVRVWFAANVADRDMVRLLLRLAVGAGLAMTPLVVYHGLTGSLWHWFDDSILRAFALSEFDYIKRQSYAALLVAAPWRAVQSPSVAAVVNGAFWPILVLLPAALGVLALRAFRHGAGVARALGPLSFVAVFYGLVPLHYQVEDYLFFGIAPVVCGLLWIAGNGGRRRVHGVAVTVFALSAVALYYHAAQPFSRGLAGTLAGERVALGDIADIPRARLHIEARDAAIYRRVLALIDAEVQPRGTILAIPANAELYFLSGRRNPLPYSFVPFGLVDGDTLNAALAALETDPPRLVFHVPQLPYNSSYTDAIMDTIRSSYERLEPIGEFEIYRLAPAVEPKGRGTTHFAARVADGVPSPGAGWAPPQLTGRASPQLIGGAPPRLNGRAPPP